MSHTAVLTDINPHGSMISMHECRTLVIADDPESSWRTYYAPSQLGTPESLFDDVVAGRTAGHIVLAQQDLDYVADVRYARDLGVPLGDTPLRAIALDDALQDMDARAAALYVFAYRYANLSCEYRSEHAMRPQEAIIESAAVLRGESTSRWKVLVDRFLASYDAGQPFSVPALVRFGSW